MVPSHPQHHDLGLTINVPTALIISCLASFRNLFSRRDTRSQAPRYIPASPNQRLLAGKIGGQSEDPNSVTGTFVNISAAETHVHGSDLEGSPIQSDLSMEGIRVKHEVDFTHETR